MDELTLDQRDELITALQTHLDTRDKRFMFLKIIYNSYLPRIQIEGSPHDTAWNIYEEFNKQEMSGSLVASLNDYFGTNLKF